MEPSNVAVEPSRSRRRQWVKRILVAVVALAVLLVAAIGFAPSFFANAFKGFAERAFADRFQGRIELGNLQLAWTSPQTIESVKLFDPSGARVLEAKIALPSIRKLWAREELGTIRIELSGDLAADDAGLTNLERAIAAKAKADEPKSPDARSGGSKSNSSSDDWRSQASKLDVGVELAASHLTWSDAHTRAAGQPVRLENLHALALLHRGERASLTVTSQLISGSPRPVSIDLKIEHPFELPSSATPPSAVLTTKLERFPTGFVDGLAGLGGKLTQTLGETFDFDATAKGTLQSGEASITLESPRADAKFEGRLVDGVLRGGQARALSISFDPDAQALDALIRGLLPAGSSLARSSQNRLELDLDELELPLARLADLGQSHEDPIAVLAQTAKAKLALELGDWSYRDAKLAPGAKALELSKLQVSAHYAPDAALRVAVTTQAPSAGAAALSLELEVPHAAQLAAALGDGKLDESHFALAANGLPLDVATNGLVDPALVLRELGSRFDLRVDGKFALAAAASGAGGKSTADLLRRVDAHAELDLRFAGRASSPAIQGALDHVRVAVDLSSSDTAKLVASWNALAPTSGADGRLELSGLQPSMLLAKPESSSIAFDFDSGSVATAALERFAGPDLHFAQRAGDSIRIRAKGNGTLAALEATASFESPLHRATFAAKWHDQTLTESGDGARIDSKLDSALVDTLLAGSLPPNAKLALRASPQTVSIAIKKFTVPIAPWLDRAPGAPLDLRKQLAGIDLGAELALGDWSWSDAALAKAGARLDVTKLAAKLELHGKDGALAASAELSGQFGDDAASAFSARVLADDALSLAEVAAQRAFAPLHVTLNAPRVPAAIVDAYAGGGGAIAKQLGAQFGVALDVQGVWKAKDSIALQSTLGLDAGSKRTKVSIDAALADPLAASERGLLPDVRAKLDVAGTEFLSSLAPDAWRALAADALGNSIALALSNRTRDQGGQEFTVSLDAPGAKLAFAGSIEKQVLRTKSGERQELSLPIQGAMLELLLGARLPKGSKLALAKEGDPFTVSITGLELPLDAWLAPKSADPTVAASPVSLAAQLDRARAQMSLSLPGLVFTQPPAKAGDPPTIIALSNLKLDPVGIEPGKLVNAQLNGSVEATPPGTINFQLNGEHPFAFLPDAPANLKPSIHFAGKLVGVPTALVDALAAQDGLVLDVLGPSLAVELSGSWPTVPGEPLQASLESSKAHVQMHAESKEASLVSSGEKGLDASLGLTPLFSQRVLGNLLPLMVDLKQTDDSKRASMTLRNFQVPLSGDLRQLNGQVMLDLGTISYRFLPGIVDKFSGGAKSTAASTTFDPIAIQITKGVAHYDSLALPIGGKKLIFKGTFDLVTKSYKMSTKLPLSMLGKSAVGALGNAAEFLGPDTEVPIHISGTSAKPSFSIDDAFVEDALKKAAGNALEGLLGKKKKK